MEDLIKKCSGCQTPKDFSEFNKCKRGKFGLHNHCKLCQKNTKRNWYIKNREKELAKSKISSKSEKAKQYRKIQWKKYKHILGPLANKRRRTEEAKVKARLQRKRWLSIPQNKIAQTLRGRIRVALKGIAKLKSSEELTGCSFEQLKIHIEKQFKDGMTWNNYGKWHIDHIKPCVSFDLTKQEEQEKCFHYTNLQPLWADENLSKGIKLAGWKGIEPLECL